MSVLVFRREDREFQASRYRILPASQGPAVLTSPLTMGVYVQMRGLYPDIVSSVLIGMIREWGAWLADGAINMSCSLCSAFHCGKKMQPQGS